MKFIRVQNPDILPYFIFGNLYLVVRRLNGQWLEVIDERAIPHHVTPGFVGSNMLDEKEISADEVNAWKMLNQHLMWEFDEVSGGI